MIRLEKALIRLEIDLRQLRLRWALIGGLAVSTRAEPRTTQDLDVTMAVEDDREADRIARDFLSRGYQMDSLLTQADTDDMIGVRLLTPVEDARGILVDLLYGFSGIEQEVVAAAELIEVLGGVAMPVATIGHLLALKTLAGRDKDRTDIRTLLRYADMSDLQQAREALDLIARRGFAKKDVDLQVEFAKYLDQST